MELEIEARVGLGADATMVSVGEGAEAFTFLVRDVRRGTPILIDRYGVAVTTTEDRRSYGEIERDIRGRGLATALGRIDREPEEDFETAAAATRELRSPVWLGVGRDVRIFELGLRQPMLYTDYVQPRFHGHGYFWGEPDHVCPRYGFVAGRGWSCTERVRRWLEEGSLPIVHVERIDEGLRYEYTMFATLENTVLAPEAVRGTHFRVADGLCVCHSLTEAEQREYLALRDDELDRPEETVLAGRIVATNDAAVPRYAFFKTVFPHKAWGDPAPHGFDRETGYSLVESGDGVFAVSRLNGEPLGQEEIAVLLGPGESCTFEFFVPHRPIPRERAAELIRKDFDNALERCRAHWRGKLTAGGELALPERRIDEMVRASVLHLDLTAYGREPDGPVAMTDGVYSPVASEIWVNLNVLDSFGWHHLVRRCLDYYLARMREDGFVQTFVGYMLENGAVLLALGEHYRYTRDDAWVRTILPKLRRLYGFLLDWRERSRREGMPYGLLKGQVADPVDHEQVYMLNAYAYSGLARAAEMLATIDPPESARVAHEAESLRNDIRKAFTESLARGPVVPLGDGTWSPTAGPWFGRRGPCCLFTDGRTWWTHGSMTVRDDIIGPMHLVSQGVFDPHEDETTTLLDYQAEVMFCRNVAASQPYYSQHPLVHLRRGEVKRFLKAYYGALAALADREIYSWWEHFYHESIHKTHEEAEFLLQTRRMLYLEDGDTLQLLSGVPRAWLADGHRIEVKNMASYFGRLSFTVDSAADGSTISARIICEGERRPRRVVIRLPHPRGLRPVTANGGTYDPDAEAVTVDVFTGTADVRLVFVSSA